MTDKPDNTRSLGQGVGIAVLSAAVLSLTAILIRHLTQAYHLPTLVLAFWRDALVSLTLATVLLLLRPRLIRIERRRLPFVAAYGLILATFNILWTLSVSQNGAAVSTVLVFSSTAFTALLGRWLLKEPLTGRKLAAVACSLAGCVLISGALHPSAWQTNALGILTGSASGLCYASYSVMGRAASQRGINSWTTMLYTFGFAAVYLLVINRATLLAPGAHAAQADLFWLGDAWSGWGYLFLLAAGPTLVGFGLYAASLGILPSSVANLVVTLEAPFTALIAYLAFGEVLTWVQIGGAGMILLGVMLLRTAGNRPARRSGAVTVPRVMPGERPGETEWSTLGRDSLTRFDHRC